MGTYLPLFSLEVEHSYFPNDVCRGLRIAPSAKSAQLLDRSGCLLRTTDRGVLVLFDASGTEALRQRAGDSIEPFLLHFLAHASDAAFANYTEGVFGSSQSILLLDSRRAALDASGRWRLHAGASAGAADMRRLTSARAARAMSQRERHAQPHFVISIRVCPADVPQTAQQAKRYYCRLQARATVWKYYLFGDLAVAPDDVQVVDLGESCEFDAAVGEHLPDGQNVLAVRSRAPIALQDRSSQRFQLRRRDGGADKVLVKRLPVASPSLIHRETLGGVPTWVSEIYVHR
jgi:hypothetical protein